MVSICFVFWVIIVLISNWIIIFCIIFYSIFFIFLYRNCVVKEWFFIFVFLDVYCFFLLCRNILVLFWISNLMILVWFWYVDKCRVVFLVLFWVFNFVLLIKKILKYLEGFSDIFFCLNKIKKNFIFYWIVKNFLIEKKKIV